MSDKIKVLQNFSQISQVSQSFFLSSSQYLAVLNFFAKLFSGLNLGLTIQRPNKDSVSQRKTLVLPSHKVSYLPFASPKT